jgi:hypothetical protein
MRFHAVIGNGREFVSLLYSVFSQYGYRLSSVNAINRHKDCAKKRSELPQHLDPKIKTI